MTTSEASAVNKASAKHIERTMTALASGYIDAACAARALTAEHRAARTKAARATIEALIAAHCAEHVKRLPNGALVAA